MQTLHNVKEEEVSDSVSLNSVMLKTKNLLSKLSINLKSTTESSLLKLLPEEELEVLEELEEEEEEEAEEEMEEEDHPATTALQEEEILPTTITTLTKNVNLLLP